MANICMDCKKACGGCSWSGRDPVTGKIKYEPVEGWTATERVLYLGKSKGVKRSTMTYDIKACPLFERDERRKSNNAMAETEKVGYCKMCGELFEKGKTRKKYCLSCVPLGYAVIMGKVRKKSGWRPK